MKSLVGFGGYRLEPWLPSASDRLSGGKGIGRLLKNEPGLAAHAYNLMDPKDYRMS